MTSSAAQSSWEDPVAFSDVWSRTVAQFGERCFLVFEGPGGNVADWTYAEFDDVVARMAAALADHGAGPGTAVHLALANSPTFVAVWLAAMRLGAWIVPSDPMGRTPELADHVARTDPVVCLGAVTRLDVYRPACGDRPLLAVDEADTGFGRLPDRRIGHSHVERGQVGANRVGAEQVGAGNNSVPYIPAVTDRAAVMFTSGTTGRPKGVEITQANYAFAAKTMAEAAAVCPEDRQIVVLPLFHANAQYYSFASAIWAGASVALMHRFSARGFLDQCARHRATCASLFAAPMRMILARGGPVDGVMLRHCWFAQNVSAEQFETIAGWFGCRPRQLYGMTETIPAVLADTDADPRPDTMGRVTPGCTVELHDADGRPVGADAAHEVGEIVVGGRPGITLFAGYLDDPDTTAASFRGGWFLTGDRASRTPDGRFVFDGRRSDVLKVAGENVSVVEVEGVLSSHPDVLEASVVGRADPVRDEVPVAFVVPADPARPPEIYDLLAWCGERLSKAKVPAAVTLLTELPRTSVGKIRKFVLRESVDA